MTTRSMPKGPLRITIAAGSISAAAVLAVAMPAPAHAGPLGFLKEVAKRELGRSLEQATGVQVSANVERRRTRSAGVRTSAGDFNGDGVGEAQPAPRRFEQEGHTTVPTADDVNAQTDPDGTALLLPAVQSVQAPESSRPKARFGRKNGTRVATADEVLAPKEPGTEDRTGGGFRQEGGTTVPTADDIAPHADPSGTALLLPAIQKVREGASSPSKPKR